MTKHENIAADKRAQIFEILRDSIEENQDQLRPKYLDDATAHTMISRALSSFQSPPVQGLRRAT